MPDTYLRQASALPIREGKICLVTSSNGKRWVIPKGLIEVGQSAGEAALQESWEEAGLTGTLYPEPIGTYLYEKMGKTFHVTVFVMEVHEVAMNWPERSYRQRIWVTPKSLLSHLEEPALLEVVRFALEQRFPESVPLSV